MLYTSTISQGSQPCNDLKSVKDLRSVLLTFSAPTTVSWCFLTASTENSEFDIKHNPSKARYLWNEFQRTMIKRKENKNVHWIKCLANFYMFWPVRVFSIILPFKKIFSDQIVIQRKQHSVILLCSKLSHKHLEQLGHFSEQTMKCASCWFIFTTLRYWGDGW